MDLDSTKLNTVVTTISILATIISIFIACFTKNTVVAITVLVVIVAFFIYYKYWVSQLKKWREEYIKEHNPTPNFEQELKYGGIYVQPKIEVNKDKKLLRDYFFDEVFVNFDEVFVKETKNDERVFCILGDTGMGKTAAVVNLFVDYIKRYKKSNIPYDIWLYSLADQDVFNKINAIENKVKGKSILLLDALDENDEAKDDKTYKNFIRNLEKVYQDFAFVVTTCRPQFFGDESEVFVSTRARRNGFFLKCKRLDLLKFDDDQVREYLFNLYYHEPNKELLKQKAERIIKKCPKIAQRPLVLSYIDELVGDENKNYETTLDIYDAIITKLIERETKKTSPYADEMMMQQWRDLLSEVAGYMYENKKLSISRMEYENFLSGHNLPDVMDEDNVVDKKTFRQRSLLTRTANGFEFSHKSFYEYFVAYRFFFDCSEIESVRNLDFAIQLFDELYMDYKSGKGGEHFGIDEVKENEVAKSLNNLGYELQELNFFPEAEKEYVEALEIFRKLSDLPTVAALLNNLGILHRNTGKYDDAEKEYTEALEKYRNLAESDREAYLPYVARTLNNLGVLHQNIRKYIEAEEEHTEALEKYRQLAEADREAYLPYVAGTLNNLGILHRDTGKHEKAEKEYSEALEKYRSLAEADREAYLPDMARTLNNLGNLHSDTGKHEKAEKEYSEALEIRRNLAESSPEAYLPDVAQTLNNLGNLHKNTGKYDDAEKEYSEALEIRRNLAESSPEAYLPDVAGTLFNMAIFRMEQGKLSEAAQMAQESLEKYQTMAKLSPAAFNQYVEKAKKLLEAIRAMQAEKE